MSKKIILLSTVVMCIFMYGCGSKENNTDAQQVNSETLRTDDAGNIIEINEATEIPMAENLDWEPIVTQWWSRDGNTVEVNKTVGEEIN